MLPQILLIGASGRTGRLVLQQALDRGHIVTILIRKRHETIPQHHSLTVVVGDPGDAADVQRAFLGTKPTFPIVVISTLGQTRTSGNPFAAPTSPRLFMESAMKAVLSASDSQTVKSSRTLRKIVSMSSFGTGSSYAQLNFLMKCIMNYSNMKWTLEDQNAVDEVIKAGNLAFVLVRPAMLSGKDAAEVKVFGNDGKGMAWMPSISMQSVSGFLLDAAVKDDWDGKTPVISN